MQPRWAVGRRLSSPGRGQDNGTALLDNPPQAAAGRQGCPGYPGLWAPPKGYWCSTPGPHTFRGVCVPLSLCRSLRWQPGIATPRGCSGWPLLATLFVAVGLDRVADIFPCFVDLLRGTPILSIFVGSWSWDCGDCRGRIGNIINTGLAEYLIFSNLGFCSGVYWGLNLRTSSYAWGSQRGNKRF